MSELRTREEIADMLSTEEDIAVDLAKPYRFDPVESAYVAGVRAALAWTLGAEWPEREES